MRNVMILPILLLLGCTNPTSEAWQRALRETDTAILTVSHQTHAVVRENTDSLKEIKAAIEQLNVAQVDSDSSVESEVIESVEPELPDENAHDGHHCDTVVAESGNSVSLVVTNAPFYCQPCERLKADVEAGKFEGFDVRFDTEWTPRAYPAIRFQSASSTGWAAVYGYDSGTIDRLKALTSEEAPVGAIFPSRANDTIRRQRGPVRSFLSWFR